MKEIIEHSQIELPKSLKTVLWAFVLLGAGMFVIGLATGNEEGITRTWQTLLINVMFWGGIAQAGVILSVIWQITDAKWGRPFKRLAEACAAFLPVSFVMFILVFFLHNFITEINTFITNINCRSSNYFFNLFLCFSTK